MFSICRVTDQISTRRLRVVKCAAPNMGPMSTFLIDTDGIVVLPSTSWQLQHKATTARISPGLDWLDAMFGNKG